MIPNTRLFISDLYPKGPGVIRCFFLLLLRDSPTKVSFCQMIVFQAQLKILKWVRHLVRITTVLRGPLHEINAYKYKYFHKYSTSINYYNFYILKKRFIVFILNLPWGGGRCEAVCHMNPWYKYVLSSWYIKFTKRVWKENKCIPLWNT